MAGRLVATVVLAAGGALSGALGAQRGSTAQLSPFGTSVQIHIAHVGHIEVDLRPPAAGRLARVPCRGGEAGAACFVGLPR
jgi:hypothetical protein